MKCLTSLQHRCCFLLPSCLLRVISSFKFWCLVLLADWNRFNQIDSFVTASHIATGTSNTNSSQLGFQTHEATPNVLNECEWNAIQNNVGHGHMCHCLYTRTKLDLLQVSIVQSRLLWIAEDGWLRWTNTWPTSLNFMLIAEYLTLYLYGLLLLNPTSSTHSSYLTSFKALITFNTPQWQSL